MAHHSVTALILTAIGATTLQPALQAVEINQSLYGEALIEGVFPDNYLFTERMPATANDGSAYTVDSTNNLWIRAKLGAKIKIEDRVETNISLVYDESYPEIVRFGGDSRRQVQLNDANVLLRRLVLDDLHLRVGRQAVSWNLRRGDGAFLHDSRADNPSVTSWDGARLHYNWETFTFSPYHFNLNAARDERLRGYRSNLPEANANNSLTGIHVDWQPEGTGETRLFLTGSVSQERNALINAKNLSRSEAFADKVWNYYLGFEWEIDETWTLYGEGSIQEGRLGDGRKLGGFAYSLGAEWNVGGENNAIVGLQYDFLSGDDDPSTGTYDNFINPWEGVSDTLMVEHERYGEFSSLVVGNLSAVKARAEYKFDLINPARPFHLKFIWGYFVLNEPVSSAGASHFGNEFNLSVSWQYNKFTAIDFFGGIFLPGAGYQQAAAAAYQYNGGTPDKEVTIFGTNINVTF